MLKHQKRLEYLVKMASCVPKVGSGRLAAAVWRKNELVSVGVNQKKTHPIQKKYKDNPHREFLHAEVDAVIKAKRLLGDDLTGCYVYVARARECEDGFEQAMAKSCGGCSQCASDFGIKGIFYTTYDGFGYQECRN